MKIFAHLPACFRYWHFTRALRNRPAEHDLAEVWAEINAIWDEVGALGQGQDSLDRGLIEADLNGSRANARVEELFKMAEEAGLAKPLQDEHDHGTCGDDCGLKFSDRVKRDANLMPPGHPESLVSELPAEDEQMLAAWASEWWPNDEYTAIATQDWQERGGAG
jgi:hypothetical protein